MGPINGFLKASVKEVCIFFILLSEIIWIFFSNTHYTPTKLCLLFVIKIGIFKSINQTLKNIHRTSFNKSQC